MPADRDVENIIFATERDWEHSSWLSIEGAHTRSTSSAKEVAENTTRTPSQVLRPLI